ncbi:uncharacterized protein LOC110978795, partial [Acanthaster planci]|uniref:Uncharacterized protein LOC110978795 n=1 Tax=Acanthaster planci TaxID=133434 RepID=A0A8B7YBK6_ACAPL
MTSRLWIARASFSVNFTMKMAYFSVMALVLVLGFPAGAKHTSDSSSRSKVLLLLLDGMRSDLYGEPLPGLKSMEMNGVRAEWLTPAYITLSMPCMYTIVTGLYPESHGITFNKYYNLSTGYKAKTFYETLNITDWFNSPGVEPIWVTAIKHGLKAGTVQYPGGNVAIQGIRPTKNSPGVPWQQLGQYPLKGLIDIGLDWLKNDDMDLVLVYSGQPDSALHGEGIGSATATAKMHEVDKDVKYLFEKSREMGLEDTLDVIVTSDHGHVNIDPRRYVELYDYINASDIQMGLLDYGNTFQIEPVEGKLDTLYNALVNAHPQLNVYKKLDFPTRFHYASSDRIMKLLGHVDSNWYLFSRKTESSFFLAADHGYDNQNPEMRSIFYAQGPSFKKGFRSEHFESVNIYPMICDLLGLEPAPNNGSRENYKDLFDDGSGSASTFRSLGVAMLTSVFTSFVLEKVFLMLVDALRWDRLGYEFPSLDAMEENGVRAEWTDPVFITQSSPSMMSIATGLYVESHGVVHNQAFDPETGEISPNYLAGLNSTWWFNGGGQPIWLTAMDQGLKAGTFMYPGGQVPINGRQPTRWQVSSNPEMKRFANLTDRADVIFDWLYGKDDLDLVLIHVEVIDNALHAFGFTALDIAKKEAEKVNELIDYILTRMKDERVKDTLNFLITADHGMTINSAKKRIYIYDYINETDIDFIFADVGPVFQIKPKDGALQKVYSILKDAHPAMYVYMKEDFPERFHFANNPRNLPIIGYVDPTWAVMKKRRFIEIGKAADHGYDNEDMTMKSSFYAQGPSFKKGYLAKHFESVNIYPLMCELLGIVPAPNNGSRDNYKDMLGSKETICDCCPNGQEKVFLMLVDALRWDRLGYEFPSLDAMEENGVRAEWTDPVFITLSSPSMMSIATGLYVESHGVVHNQPFDPETGEISPGYLEGLNSSWWFNGGGQPIWLTAMDQGLKAGTFMYPGGQVPINGRQPTRWQVSSTPERKRFANLTDRADVIFDWLYGKDDLDLVLFHVEVIDNALHAFGFTALDIAKKEAEKVNELIDYILTRMKDERVKVTLNFLITGDHGMTINSAKKRIYIYDYINETDVDFIFTDVGPLFQIKPIDGALQKVYSILKDAHPAMYVYMKEDFPERFHFANNPRNLPIIGYVDPTWAVMKKRRFIEIGKAADHGYDNEDMTMKSSFYAQ